MLLCIVEILKVFVSLEYSTELLQTGDGKRYKPLLNSSQSGFIKLFQVKLNQVGLKLPFLMGKFLS